MSSAEELSLQKILHSVQEMRPDLQKQLFAELKKRLYPEIPSAMTQMSEEIREARFKKSFTCPHCGHDKATRYGTQNGNQRYRCPACAKLFNDLTCTPLRGTHYPEKWLPFMECLVKGLSLRKCAEKLGICLSTVFVWRHKVLAALRRLELPSFEGILEVDETYILYSEKGRRHIEGRMPRKRGGKASKRGLSNEQVCIVVARDRKEETHAQVACTGQISKAQAKAILDPYVSAVSHLCSDANGTWRAFAGDAKVPHVELNLSQKVRVKRRIYHVQNVNAYHKRLKDWLHRFCGVASKFLDNYLIWFRFVDAHGMEAMVAKRRELLIDACQPVSPETYLRIKQTEFALPV